MANKTRSKKRRRQKAAKPSTTKRAAAPKSRYPALFRLLSDLAQAGDAALQAAAEAGPINDEQRFDFSVLTRAVNAVKSTRLLLEQAHWEFAAGPVRQLFELAVNLEYINSRDDPEQARFQYAKFGLLQMVEHKYLTLLYDEKAGREIDQERMRMLKRMLKKTFPEFRTKQESDPPKFVKSWSRKTTKELARLSKHPMRVDQYELLFSTWSEQVHASPRTLLGGMYGRYGDDFVAEAMAEDDVQIVETAGLCLTLFLELWHQLKYASPPDGEANLRWIKRFKDIARERGAPLPD